MHYAHAGVMARARILFIRSRTTCVFRIFVTSVQLINREYLAFPPVNFFKKSLHFLTVAVPLYCPFLLKSVRAKFLYLEKLKISIYWQNRLNDPMFQFFSVFSMFQFSVS